MTLARVATSVGVGSANALLGPVVGPVEAFGAMAVGTYFQVLAPGALPDVDEALTAATSPTPLGCLRIVTKGGRVYYSSIFFLFVLIAWGALGAAMDCYDSALRYSKERIQFGKPIGAFQLTQKKLAEMITEITKAQLLTWRLGVLKNENRATTAQISMAKRNNVDMALNIAREARQVLGAMGITGEYSIMRHMMNLESVVTYEGTHDIHLLITGMDITGIPAFK